MAAGAAGDKLELAGADELEPQVLVDLVYLLREQNLSAMDSFSSLSRQHPRALSRPPRRDPQAARRMRRG
jgi:hypothetical protein